MQDSGKCPFWSVSQIIEKIVFIVCGFLGADALRYGVAAFVAGKGNGVIANGIIEYVCWSFGVGYVTRKIPSG